MSFRLPSDTRNFLVEGNIVSKNDWGKIVFFPLQKFGAWGKKCQASSDMHL